jgi:hypothetical protein
MGSLPIAFILASALFAGMLFFLEIGHRWGERFERLDPGGAHAGTGAVEGAVFALFGLLIAFTFSGAAARFDVRRHLVVEEANAIGTAYLRLDTVPEAARAELRDRFRRYLDARLETYRSVPDFAAVDAAHARAVTLQGEIWARSVAACGAAGATPCAILLLPALNQMIDITTTRMTATEMHPPSVVTLLLFALGFACAFLAGYSLASGTRRKWPHMLAFAAVTTLTVYVILDFEYPRLGLIRVNAFDHVLADLRAEMDR